MDMGFQLLIWGFLLLLIITKAGWVTGLEMDLGSVHG
jgi:hypothetical protein